MPTTVNGVGTHYYGKKDAASRPGTCRSCGASCNLESYTTRLWFVIVFIPIIPLKRVRILDYCPRCSRHYTANPEQYEMSRQLAVSGALEKHRESPTVESALVTHGQYLSFHMHTEADTFREAALAQMPDHPELIAGFASHLDQVGRWQEATPLYEKVLALKPELVDARYALAWRRTNEGKLDEAYELLDYLRQPGSGVSYNLEPLKTLAEAYQKKKQHDKALELFAVHLREAPAVGTQYEFRRLVAKSEKALGLTTSLLPEQKRSLRGLIDSKSGTHAPWMRWAAYGSIVGVLFLGGMAALNEYYRRHRTLHVLNAFAQPVHIAIDGGPPVAITKREMLAISEGQHQIALSGPVTRQIAADIRTPYFSRWLSSPVWIIDVEGLSAVYESRITYSANPQPPVMRYLDAELNFIPHVDYLFTDPPESMQVEGKNGVVRKVHVGRFPQSPNTLLLGLLNRPDQSVALTFAEGHLERSPQDALMLGLYSQRIEGEANERRVAEFLKSRLWEPVVSIPWHRAYLNLKSVRGREAEMRDEYDEHRKTDRENPALLYLRGYVSDSREERVRLYRRSLMKDQALGWPALGLAAEFANVGDWVEAKKFIELANGRLRQDQSLRTLRHTLQMAVGEFAPLETEYRGALQGQDLLEMMVAVGRLTEILVAQGRIDDARAEFQKWWSRMNGGNAPGTGTSPYELLVDYICGDTDRFRQKETVFKPDEKSDYRFHFLLAADRPDDAAQFFNLGKVLDEWQTRLQLSLCYSVKGNAAEAEAWRIKACEKLKEGDGDERRAANLLERGTAPTDEELDKLLLRLNDTPLVLTTLARRFPDRRDALNQRAARLNISRHAPYLLVKRALETP